MEYNVENLFDTHHDSLKNDMDYLPDGSCHWTRGKYWRKLNAVARGIVLSSTEDGKFFPPSVVGLCEVENDSVLHALTRRSLLRGAGYEYVMTDSPDNRGIDVALLYQPSAFRADTSYSLRVDTVPGMRPTRDILYVRGATLCSSAAMLRENPGGIFPLHIFVLHSPSRRGGEKATREFRMAVARRLMQSVDSIRVSEPRPHIIVMGDFNDHSPSAGLTYLASCGLTDITSEAANATIGGTYRYKGEWGSLDHILVSEALLSSFRTSCIGSHPELLEPDTKYGGVKPRRFFLGPVARNGYSDHLPLISDFVF
ncbi:MAG: endonuclease/exonuclease/phosphatase family protein [Bacteroidales bacterium]|nr:endonuclease/exonuclease/phosphatase family protein [Bacteroidales bacterium]MCM1148197.1 endonuclease/exonuclease/phosphatase family protein [Bacteroidales bacterium]MCM1207076.1 endonuclease/exonuclease/phosphatase family protein [Bacillota bacterium]MCM1510820.1 endonuclease/exonuclease/phosphatase family protein [Clostridium sp.]